MLQYVGMGGGIIAAAGLLRWLTWLIFCIWYINKTGGTEGLPDVRVGRQGRPD